MTRIPLPPYPNGWYNICYSHEVTPGEVKAVHAIGQDFVVYEGVAGALTSGSLEERHGGVRDDLGRA